MRKVRIVNLPKAQYGAGVNNYISPSSKSKVNFKGPGKNEPPVKVNSTLKPADRDKSNLEVEKGEVVISDTTGDGLPEHYVAGGKLHSEGGTPVNLSPHSFVFSQTKTMKITDPEILKLFNMGTKKSGYTPAHIAKKYTINDYQKVLADKNSDQTQKDTAEAMIANYNEKLAKLSLVQESMKGYPQGIPKIAMPYIETSGWDPSSLFGTQAQQEDPSADQMQEGGGVNEGTTGVKQPNIVKNFSGSKVKLSGDDIINYVKDLHKIHPENFGTKEQELKKSLSSYDYGRVMSLYDSPQGKSLGSEDNYNFIVPDKIGVYQDSGTSLLDILKMGGQKVRIVGLPKAQVGLEVPKGTTIDGATYDGKNWVTLTGGRPHIANEAEGNKYKSTYQKQIQDAQTKLTAEQAKEAASWAGWKDVFAANAARVKNGVISTPARKLKAEQKTAPVKTTPNTGMYSEDYLKKYADKYPGQDMSGAFPAYLNDRGANPESVAAVQKSQGNNIAGKLDFASPEMMKDFINRQAWYIKDHPSFDPHKKEDVKAFQDAYNKRHEAAGLGKYDFKDTQFGQYTHGAPNLDYTPKTKEIAAQAPADGAGDNTKVADILPGTLGKTETDQAPADFWMQDIIKNAGAFGDLTRIKKYLPWQGTYNPYLPTPTFADPTRELAANAEQSNIASQAAGMFAGPQGLNARLNQIQGQGAENAANILAKYNNINIGTSNQFAEANANTMNQFGQNRANQATELYDKNVIANQSFDNAKNMARQNLRQSFMDALTNRGQTQALNTMYPQYHVDPLTGMTSYTGKAKDLKAEQSNNDAVINRMNAILEKNPSWAHTPEGMKIAHQIASGSSGTEDNKNAWLQQMMSQSH